MSHWSAGYNGVVTQDFKNSIKLSLLLAEKHFNEVVFITDSMGKQELGDLGWSKVITYLDEFNTNLGRTWSYGKLKVFEFAARTFGHFIHIDNDFFMWGKPSDEVLKSSFFAVCKEIYLDEIFEVDFIPYLEKYKNLLDLNTKWMPNLSLCGGTDTDFWMQYASLATKIVEDIDLFPLWTGRDGPGHARACIAEQWMLASMLDKQNKKIDFLFPNKLDTDVTNCTLISEEIAANTGFSHLGHHKTNPDIMKRIAERVNSSVPNLEMRQDKKLPEQLKSLKDAMFVYANDGFRNCAKEDHSTRLKICEQCQFWSKDSFWGLGKCKKCGCSGAKLWIASSKCPIGKWGELT